MKQLRFCAAVVLGLSIAACGGVGGDEASEDTGGGGDSGGSGGGSASVSGTIDMLGFGVEDVIAESRVKTVEQTFPDLDVKVNSGAFEQQAFLTAVASGEPPDVVYIPRAELGTYAARGALTPLEDCLSEHDVDMGMYRDSAMSQVTYDGTVYGVPEFSSIRMMLTNTDALRSAGMSADDVDASDWDQLATLSQQLMKESGSDLTRIGFDPKLPEYLPLWSAANGGQLLSDDGLEATLNSPENVEALEFTSSLVEQQGGWGQFKAFRDTWDFFGDNNQFVADQVGAFPMEDWYLDVLADVSPNAPVEVREFTDREGQPLTYATGQAWAIPKGSADSEAACAFAVTMTATDTWLAAAKASKADRDKSGGVYLGTWTANEEADQRIMDEVFEPTGIAALDHGVQVVESVQDDAIVDPPSPAAAEVRTAWEDAVLRVLEGEQTAQEALDEAQQEAAEAIEAAQ